MCRNNAIFTYMNAHSVSTLMSKPHVSSDTVNDITEWHTYHTYHNLYSCQVYHFGLEYFWPVLLLHIKHYAAEFHSCREVLGNNSTPCRHTWFVFEILEEPVSEWSRTTKIMLEIFHTSPKCFKIIPLSKCYATQCVTVCIPAKKYIFV